MPIEWLLIGLPVVFALGWFAARLDIRHIQKNIAELPAAYLGGLRQLLNGEEQKALETFSKIEQTELLPPELQFTTAKLSRQRGDYQRALSLHQQIYKNERLPDTDRNRALWELANDCAAMGFVDTAEQYAGLLAKTPAYRERVFRFLLKNYQTRRRYRDALSLIENADEDWRRANVVTAAQLHCQLAEAAADADNAAALLDNALALNPACARARLMRAENFMAAQQARPAEAIEQYKLIEDNAPRYLWLAAAPMFRALQVSEAEGVNAAGAAGDKKNANEAGKKMLSRWLMDYPSTQMLKSVIAVFDAEMPDETAAADALIGEFLAQHNSLAAAAYFIQRRKFNGDTRQWLSAQKALLAAEPKAFACGDCAYEMTYFVWQCPGCLAWERMRENA